MAIIFSKQEWKLTLFDSGENFKIQIKSQQITGANAHLSSEYGGIVRSQTLLILLRNNKQFDASKIDENIFTLYLFRLFSML